MRTTPVLKPLLPTAERIAPYLARIDATRWYSNIGPLVRDFEEKLALHFGAPADRVVTSANGTLAMIQALSAMEVAPGGHCVTPAWAFVAAPAAALAAGLKPYFVDVDPATWAMTPAAVEAVIAEGHRVSAAVPVAPFGAPIDLAAWEEFHRRTGVAVLIDAAAGFDAFAGVTSTLPYVVSLHATKAFGIGEGAVVVSPTAELARHVRRAGNFGFHGSREAQVPGINAKLSEYAAAVGLAAFEAWRETRPGWVGMTDRFAQQLGRLAGLAPAPGFGAGWISSYGNVQLDRAHNADALADALAREGVETRAWWGKGCHRHAAYRDCPRAPLPVTDDLAQRVLGLPFWLGLDDDSLNYVFDRLADALAIKAA